MEALEKKINGILEEVAPMQIKKLAHRGKPCWITEELETCMKERKEADRKARRTRLMEDELQSRRIRNQVAKEIKSAKTNFVKIKLNNLSQNSSTAWDAVNDYLGWKKPTAPTQLVQDGTVISEGPGLAEAMIKQYEKKEREVKQALGEAKDNYLAASRKLTAGNKAVFTWKKLTKKEVEKKISEVGNKESFGEDKISYGFLKKMSAWISQELTEIINLSLEIKVYPSRWKTALFPAVSFLLAAR